MVNVVLKSKKGLHYAEGLLDGKTIIILKGAKINLIDSFFQMSPALLRIRHDKTIVSNEGILLQNVTFNTPSTAAQFVTGRSVNGYIAWRPNDEMSLKIYLMEQKSSN